MNKRSSKLLLMRNVISPKSITTQIKELKEEDTHLKQKSRISSIDSKKQEDPTDLRNILNALNHSSKIKPYLQSNDGNVPQELISEICDFKNVGDLSNVSFTEENSFQENTSNEEQSKQQTEVEKTLIKDKTHKLDEERTDEDLSNASLLSVQVLIGQCQLEDERIILSQMKCLKVRDEYLKKLITIRQTSLQSLSMLRAESHHSVVQEQQKLKSLLSAAQQEAILTERKYLEKVQKNEDDLLQEVETVAEEALKKEALIQALHAYLETFRDSLTKVQQDMSGDTFKESELHKIVFQELPPILSATDLSVSKMLQSTISTTEADIHLISNRIAEAVLILANIQRLLDQSQPQPTQTIEPKEGLSASVLEAPPTPQTDSPQPSSSLQPQQSETSQTDSVFPTQSQGLGQPRSNEGTAPQTNEKSDRTSTSLSYFPEAGEAYSVLRSKFNSVCTEGNSSREHATLRPLLSRAVGIINTVNNQSNDSSNREKLQQILNLVNGRTCTIGSDTLTTKNNPSAQAFVKEQIASRLINLSHDKQILSMAIYASLIVRLWQLVPEIGDLILFKLYETCPLLVPLTIQRHEGQTEEEFNRFLGFRHKEGSERENVDKYLSRMSACAELYGRIVSMDVDNHPHGIQEGWLWIVRTLTLPPYPSVTAALLCGFLKTAGARLLKYYGVQFRKLMQYIWTSYLKQIEEDMLEGSHGEVERLKLFLTEYARTNTVPQVAEGYKLLL